MKRPLRFGGILRAPPAAHDRLQAQDSETGPWPPIPGPWPGPYFSRRLFVTTVTLESAIAAEATTGESRPNAATGIATTL